VHHLPTFQILGVKLGIGGSTANYIFHALGKNIEGVIASFVVRTSKKKSDSAWVLEIVTEFELRGRYSNPKSLSRLRYTYSIFRCYEVQ
jgi:hypothetical protein